MEKQPLPFFIPLFSSLSPLLSLLSLLLSSHSVLSTDISIPNPETTPSFVHHSSHSVCPSTIDQSLPFSRCRSSKGDQFRRAGQVRSWGVGLRSRASFLQCDVLMVRSSGGEEWQKPGSRPVVLCNGLLFLPASGLDVDSWWCCCGVSVCVFVIVSCFDWLLSPL